jgi:hypothetical protein
MNASCENLSPIDAYWPYRNAGHRWGKAEERQAARACSHAMASGDEPRMHDDASRRVAAIANRGDGKLAA